MSACVDVEYLNRVVAKGGHVQAMAGRIERQVIDASFHTRELYRSRECQ
jgi:hypothetical protein